jgi:hypothetical protein
MTGIRILTGPDQGDAPLVFTAVELHPGCVVLNYISTAPQEELARGMLGSMPKEFRLTDDIGTEYEIQGGGGGGEGNIRRMDVKLVPPVPSGATYLKVITGVGTVTFVL